MAQGLSLSWTDNSDNEQGFRIERSQDGDSFSDLATVGSNVTAYEDQSIVPGVEYWYRVLAYNEFGESGYTNIASGVSSPVLVNEAPTISVIEDQTLTQNGEGAPLAFTVSDPESEAGDLEVSVDSSNTWLINAWGLDLSGSGSDRFLSLSPNSERFGQATITVTVSDGEIETAMSFELVVEEFVPDTIAVSHALTSFEEPIFRGESVLLSTEVQEGNDAIQKVSFYWGDQLLGDATAEPFEIEWTPDVIGNRGLKVVAESGAGQVVESQVIDLSVIAPGVTVALDLDATQMVEGDLLTLGAVYEDPFGELSSMQYFVNGVLLSEVSDSPFSVSWRPLIAGEFEIVARSMNVSGVTSDSSPVVVEVSMYVSAGVEIELTTDFSELSIDQAKTLSVSYDDPRGELDYIEYYINGVLFGSILQPPYQVDWKPSVAGRYEVFARSVSLTGIEVDTEVSVLQLRDASIESETLQIEASALGEPRVGEPVAIEVEVVGAQSDIISIALAKESVLAESRSSESRQSLEWTPTQKGDVSLLVSVETELSVYRVNLNLDVQDESYDVGIAGLADGGFVKEGLARVLSGLVDFDYLAPSTVQFYIDGVMQREDFEYPYEFEWTPTGAGESSVFVRAANSSGETFDSDLVKVWVEKSDSEGQGASAGGENSISFLGISDGHEMPYDEITTLKVLIERPEEIEEVVYYLDNIEIARVDRHPFDAKTIFMLGGEFALTAVGIGEDGSEIVSPMMQVSVAAESEEDPDERGHQVFYARDIGSVGKIGSTIYNESAGEFVINASGKQIWNDRDSFRYSYIPVAGDGSITVRIREFSPDIVWAKAGVMIRANLSSGSTNAALLLNGLGDAGFQTRDFFQGVSSQLSKPRVTNGPVYLRLVREGALISSSISFDGESWDSIGSQALSLPEVAYFGIAVNSHSRNREVRAYVDRVELDGETDLDYVGNSNTPTNSIDENLFQTDQLYSRDVGQVPEVGSVVYNEAENEYTLTASGGDVWGAEDQFRFVYMEASGDIEITARVKSIDGASHWSKAGVMIRTTLDPGSSHCSTFLNDRGTAGFLTRKQTDESTFHESSFGVGAPSYLKLSKRGSVVQSEYSLDGKSWTVLGVGSLPSSEQFYIGIALSSSGGSLNSQASIDDVIVSEID